MIAFTEPSPAGLALNYLLQAFASVDARHPPAFAAVSLNRETGDFRIAMNNQEYVTDVLVPALIPQHYPYTMDQFPLNDQPNVIELLAEIEQVAVQNDVALVTLMDFGGAPVVWYFNCTWCESQWVVDTAFSNAEQNENDEQSN